MIKQKYLSMTMTSLATASSMLSSPGYACLVALPQINIQPKALHKQATQEG